MCQPLPKAQLLQQDDDIISPSEITGNKITGVGRAPYSAQYRAWLGVSESSETELSISSTTALTMHAPLAPQLSTRPAPGAAKQSRLFGRYFLSTRF